MIDLQSTVARFARLLVPGWKVTCSTLPAEKMPIRGALAVCDPTPTRSLAHLYVVAPWPKGESLIETIAHELTHACLSPLTAMLGNHPGAIMLEEQAVENIGKALAMVGAGEARAMARAVQKYAPQLRARLSISSLATRARDGGKNMDAALVKAALDAIESGDGEKCKELLKGLLAAEVVEGEALEANVLGSNEMAKLGSDMPPGGGVDAAAAPPPEGLDGRMVARLRAYAAEIEAVALTSRQSGKATLINNLRARLTDHSGLPSVERKILAAKDFKEAQMIADIALDMGGPVDAQRARSGAHITAAPSSASGGGEAPETIEALTSEGIPLALARDYVATYKIDAGSAKALLSGARARLGKTPNPWAGNAAKGS